MGARKMELRRGNSSEPAIGNTLQLIGAMHPTIEEGPRASAKRGSKLTPITPPAIVPSTPAVKLSLKDKLRATMANQAVAEVREELGQAQFTAEEILHYVQLRWMINTLPGMAEGWSARPWNEQVATLRQMMSRNAGVREIVETIEQLHGNGFLSSALDAVMQQFGTPLQAVTTMSQFQQFMDDAVKHDLLGTGTDQPDGVSLLEDLADHTNNEIVTYVPRKGSKVANDAWMVVKEKYKEVCEAWKPFEELRASATPGLTPFKASDNENKGWRGQPGKIFVMAPSKEWAVLLKIEDKGDIRFASIEQYVGNLRSEELPVPNMISWNHRSRSINDPEKSDVWDQIHQGLTELNGRQYQRSMTEREKTQESWDRLKALETVASDPIDQGLHNILDGEKGTVILLFPNFTFWKTTGKMKNGYFGVALRCDNGALIVEAVEASDCFCFPKGLVGQKFPFERSRGDGNKIYVNTNIREFCKIHQIRGKIKPDWWEGQRLLCAVIARRLRREESLYQGPYAEEEDEQPDEEELQRARELAETNSAPESVTS